MAGWRWLAPADKIAQEAGFFTNFVNGLRANGTLPNPTPEDSAASTYSLPMPQGGADSGFPQIAPTQDEANPPTWNYDQQRTGIQAAPSLTAADANPTAAGLPDWAKPILSAAGNWGQETGGDIAGLSRGKPGSSWQSSAVSDLADLRDVGQDIMRPLNTGLDKASQYTLQPAAGIATGVLGEKQVPQYDAQGNIVGYTRQGDSIWNTSPSDYAGGVLEGLHHPMRAQQAWQEHLAGETGILATPYRGAAAAVTQPASYIGDVMPFLPEAVQSSKVVKAGEAIVGQPGGAAVGAGVGSAEAQRAGEGVDISNPWTGQHILSTPEAPDWMKAYLPLVGGIGGGVVGGHPAAVAERYAASQVALAKWQGLPDGVSPAWGLSMFDASNADKNTLKVSSQRKVAEGPVLLFHSTANDGFMRPDPSLSVGGAVGSSQLEGLYTTVDQDRSASVYAYSPGGRTFVIQPAADVQWHDLTRMGGTQDPILSRDGGTTMTGPTWEDVQAKLVEELRGKGMQRAANAVEKAFEPAKLKLANEQGPGGAYLRAQASNYDRVSGQANGYVYRSALVRAMANTADQLPTSLLGRFQGAVDTAATNTKKAGVYMQETLGNMGMDGTFHDSHGADGDTYIIVNSKKFNVVGEGRNMKTIAGQTQDGMSTYDIARLMDAAGAKHTGDILSKPSFVSFGKTDPLFPNLARVFGLSKDTSPGIAAGAIDPPYGAGELAPAPLTPRDKTMNLLQKAVGRVPQENPYVAPVMRWRRTANRLVADQAQREAEIIEPIVDTAFPMIKNSGDEGRFANGRISNLPGMPTIQDVAAHLPTFRPFLTPEQLAVMARLADEVQPYVARLEQNGVNVGQRGDIEPGGFYLPRGRADWENEFGETLDSAGNVVPASTPAFGKAGGKKGFEKTASEASMAEGMEHGLQYRPLAESMARFAGDAGRRSIDANVANYFATVKDDAGNLLGTTPAARLLAQNGPLKARIDYLRQSLTSMTQTGVRLSLAQQRVIDDFMLNPAPDVQALQDSLANLRVGASATGAQGPNFGKSQQELQAAISDVKNQLRDLAPDWKAALDHANQMPRGQGGISFPQLTGTSFPDAIASSAAHYLNSEVPPSGKYGTLMRTVDATNDIMRGLKATFDMSFAGLHGFIGGVSHPSEYGKAMQTAFKGGADPQAIGKFLLDFDAKATAAGLPTSRDLIASGLHIGGMHTEFALSGTVPRFFSAVHAARPIAASDRMWGYFGDTLRLELAQTAYQNALANGFDMRDPANMAAATTGANLATGWSPTTFGGGLGHLGMFAPRFFQSQLDMVANLAKGLPGTGATPAQQIIGHNARDMMVKYLGAAALITIGANEASSQPIPMKALFDPTDSRFMRIRIGGQSVSLLGQWDTLLKGVVAGVKGDPWYMVRSKASPILGTAWDLISGKTFTGEEARPNTAGGAEGLLKNLVPFALTDVDRDTFTTTQGAAGLGWGLSALKSRPMTPAQQMDLVSKAQFNGTSFRDLGPQESLKLKNEHPDIWQRMVENGSQAEQDYAKAKVASAQEQQAADDALTAGTITKKQWRDEYSTRRDKLVGLASAPSIYGPPKQVDNPKTWHDRYNNLLIDSKNADGSIDWDKADQAISLLPQKDQQNIIEQKFVGSTPMVEQYKQATLTRSEMYGLPKYQGYTGEDAGAIDRALADIKNLAGPKAPVSRQLQALATVQGLTPSQLKGAEASIYGTLKTTPAIYRLKNGKLGNQRQKFADDHPEIAQFYGPGDY